MGAAAAGNEASTGSPPLDPARLGMTEERLRELFGDTLHETRVESPRSLMDQVREPPAAREGERESEPPEAGDEARARYAEQLRLVREVGHADLRLAEYELFRGRVYRIRWRLAQRFERPVMDSLVALATERLGRPVYDQVLKAKLASPRAELRRVGWERADRALELRQLHPLNGGPLFLSVLDRSAAGRIVAARGTPMPEPDSAGPWWQRPRSEDRGVTSAERATLVAAFEALLARVDF